MALDTVSLTAMIIVVGIIVDDAIIVAENIYRHFSELKRIPVEAAVMVLPKFSSQFLQQF